MKQAAAGAYKALLILVKPKEDNYTLYLACLQQMGDNTRAAEILELMVNQFPKNKNNWLYLFQVYSTMVAPAIRRLSFLQLLQWNVLKQLVS